VTDTTVYRVPGMSCGHCVQALEGELAAVPGVDTADADLDTKTVTVRGRGLEDTALRAAIAEAGYEAE
jgi:copper chaperone CopZ